MHADPGPAEPHQGLRHRRARGARRTPPPRGALLAAALLISGLLAGCGGAAAPAPAKPATPAPSSQPAAPASGAAPSAAASATKPLTSVNAAWVAITANQTPVMMAEDAGYFKQQGLNVHLSYIQGSITAMPAMLSGQVQFIEVGGTTVADAAANGAKVEMVGAFLKRPAFDAMTSASLTKPSQLKGSTWAVTKIGNVDYFALLAMLKHFGVPRNEVKIIAAANPPGQVAAVSSGHAQGAVLSPPNNVLAQERGGLHLFFDLHSLPQPYLQDGIAVTDAYAKAHPKVVTEFMAACIEGIHRFKTDPALADQVMKKYLHYTDPKVLAGALAAYSKDFPQDPNPTAAEMQTAINQDATQNPKVKDVNAASIIDASYVDSLQSSGFIQKVYGS